MISKLNNKPFDESDETLFEVQLTYLWYNVDFNISNPYQHSMLTQYDREMQQSSKFIFRSQDDKKKLERCGSREKGKKISSLPNLPIYVQFYAGNHNAKVL